MGLLDESFFFYGEEKDWCYRAAEMGYETYYHPDAPVIHYGGQSSRQVSHLALSQLYATQEKFLYKHYRPAYARLLTLVLRLGLGFKALGFHLLGLLQPADRRNLWQKATLHAKVFRERLSGQAGGSPRKNEKNLSELSL